MTVQKSPEKSCFVRFTAILLVTLFVPASILAVLMFNINTVLVDRDTYKTALARRDTYSRIPGLTAEQMTFIPAADDCAQDSCQLGQPGSMVNSLPVPASYTANLDPSAWEAIFTLLMPADWVQAQAESTVDQVFDSLNTPGQPISAVISLESMRSRLTDADYQTISRTVLATAPACSEEDLLTYAAIMMGGSAASLPFCIPSEEFRPVLENAISTVAYSLVQSLPAEFTVEADAILKPSQNTDETGGSDALTPSSKLKWLRLLFMISPLIPLILLGFIGSTAVRSWGDAGRWWGLPLAVSGLAVMLIAVIALLASPWLATNFLLPRLAVQACPGIIQLIQEVFRSVLQRYALWNGMIAGVMFLGGAIAYAVFGWYKTRQA